MLNRDRHCWGLMEQSANKIESPSRISWAAGVLGALLLTAVAVILAGDVAFRLRSERTIEQERTELDRYATFRRRSAGRIGSTGSVRSQRPPKLPSPRLNRSKRK